LCFLLVLANVFYGIPGAKQDQAILRATVRIIKSRSEYKDVHAEVEDGIVTLTGKVELESSRSALKNKIRHIAHVAGVRNQIALFPPPVADEVLLHRLSATLRDAGYGDVKIAVHNGAVVVTGIVRTEKDRNWATQLVWQTDGVREVQAELSVASTDPGRREDP